MIPIKLEFLSQKSIKLEKQLGSQEINYGKTNHIQKKPPTLAVKDDVSNATVKPETTRRRDDETGRLPYNATITSPRLMRPSRGKDPLSSQSSAFQRSGIQSFENPLTNFTTRKGYSANIWQKRQEKQQFLAELRPFNQVDEEMQLEMALELSKQQAEIDAQQRYGHESGIAHGPHCWEESAITTTPSHNVAYICMLTLVFDREIYILEKQMEETLHFERELQLKTSQNTERRCMASATETNSTSSVIEDESFPPLPVCKKYKQESKGDESMIGLSCEGGLDGSSCDNDDTKLSKGNLLKCDGVSEGYAFKMLPSNSDVGKGDNITMPKLGTQLPRPPKEWKTEIPISCRYGKNCCLGKRCKYSHPSSNDTRKRCMPFQETASQDPEALSNIEHTLERKPKDITIIVSSDTQRKGNTACVDSTFSSDPDESGTKQSKQCKEDEKGANQIEESETVEKKAVYQKFTGDASSSLQEEKESKKTDLCGCIDPVIGESDTSSEDCLLYEKKDTWKEEKGASITTPKGESAFPINSQLFNALNPASPTVCHVTDPIHGVRAMNQATNTVLQPTNLPVDVTSLNRSANSIPQLDFASSALSLKHATQITKPENDIKELPKTVDDTPPNSTFCQGSGNSAQHASTSVIPKPLAGVETFSALPGFPSLSFFPFLDPAVNTGFDQTVTATLMAPGSVGAMLTPMMVMPCNLHVQGEASVPPCFTVLTELGKQNEALDPCERFQTGLASSHQSAPPGMPPLNESIALGRDKQQLYQGAITANPKSKALVEVNGLLGMSTGTGAMLHSQTGLTGPSAAVLSPQIPMGGFSRAALGSNMLGTVTYSRSSASLNMFNLRYPFPFINPQALGNTNTEMTSMVVPDSTPQESCQSARSDELQSPRTKVKNPADAKIHDTGVEKGPTGVSTKAPLLRRPATSECYP
ncbi:uncharacterized protein [Montipora capricornis]|uniref:uncharacterized protein n=1 Tax=Montipora capricornis TaxID=246305 RepID=UPI0035F1E677